MGSAFSSVLGKIDPIGRIAAAHPNSFLGKAASAGPLAGTGFQKAMNPYAYQAQAERNAQFQTPANTVQSGAFAGKAPSLVEAQTGYNTPSVGVANGTNTGMAGRTMPVGPIAWTNAAPGGTNFFNAPPAASAGANPAAYVQAAGRATGAQGPQSYGSGGY